MVCFNFVFHFFVCVGNVFASLFFLYLYFIFIRLWQALGMVVEAFWKVLVRFLGCLGVSWGGLGEVLGGLGGVLGGLGYKGLLRAPRIHPQNSGISRPLEAKMVQVGPKLGPKTFKNPFRRPSQK